MIKIVRFSNGKFGLQKGVFFYKYLDFHDRNFWRGKDSKQFVVGDCFADNPEIIKKIISPEKATRLKGVTVTGIVERLGILTSLRQGWKK